MTEPNSPPSRGSLATATDLILALDGAEQLPTAQFLEYLTDYDIHPGLVATILSVHNPELVRSRMNELEQYGWSTDPVDPKEFRGVGRDFARYWAQVHQSERLIVILERSDADPLALGNYAVRGPGQWLIEAIWHATGVTPVNPGNSENSAFVAAWSAADHPDGPPTTPEEPISFVPMAAGLARMATGREAFRALLWPTMKSIRSGALPLLAGGTALWTAAALWLIGIGPFWIVLAITLPATVVAVVGWTALSAHHLSRLDQRLLISTDDDAIIGLKIVRDATPHIEVHTHYATPIGSGTGRRFRARLLPHVKEFVTVDEPGLPIQFTCPDGLWRKLEEEIGQSFPAGDGWQIERTKTRTTIRLAIDTSEPTAGLSLDSPAGS